MKKITTFFVPSFFLVAGVIAQSQPIDVIIQMKHTDAVSAVSFSPSGELFSTGSTDRSLKLWDLKTGKELRRFVGPKEGIDNIHFSADGAVLFCQSGGTANPKIFFWEVQTGALKNTIELPVWEKVIASNPHKNEFITTILEDKTLVKSIPDGKIVNSFKGYNIVSPDGQYQVVKKEKIRGYEVLSLKTKKLICSLPDKFGDCQFKFSADGKTLFMYMIYVTQINLNNGETKSIEFFNSSANDCWEVSSDGNVVVSRSGKQSVHVWDFTTDEVKPFEFREVVTCIGVSPITGEFFVGFANGDFQFIDYKSRKVRLQSYGVSAEIRNVSTTANPNLFLTRGTTGDFVWSMKQMKVIHELGNYQIKHNLRNTLLVPEQLAGSPQNHLAVTANNDFTLSVWDVPSGNELKKLTGHDTLVSGVDISPDGKWVVSVPKHGKPMLWSVETGKMVAQFNEVNLLQGGLAKFFPDNKILSIVPLGEIYLYSIPTGSFISKHTADVGDGQVAISPDGKFLVSPFLSTPSLFSLVEKKPVGKIGDLDDGNGAAFSTDGGYLFLSHENRASVIEMSNRKVISHLNGHTGTILQGSFTDNIHLLTCCTDGTVKFWDAPAGKLIATFIVNNDQEYGVITNDNYYTMSKSLAQKLHFVKGTDHFSFDNFDLVYNRPDIVAQQLGKADDKQIKALRAAYLKRIKKMGFTENQLSRELHLPQLSILSKNLPIETNQKTIKINVLASDTKYPLDRLNVYINNVPVMGTKGLQLRDKKIQDFSYELDLELLPGKNRIQISCMNTLGVESYKSTVDIFCTSLPELPNLYLVNIGVSEFSDKAFNLSYAAKDANDISNAFKKSKSYGHVTELTFLNDKATTGNIVKTKEILATTRPQDVVILFVATHGLLDSKFDYYLATTNVNFENPSQNGLLYDDLESLLDGIPARNKLMLLDACHSGEVDKEELEIQSGSNNQVTTTANVKTRGFKTISKKENQLGIKNSFELMQELFTDLSKGTGTVVVSSAGGAEYAYESGEWSNGVFTYVLLEGIKTGKADVNNDGKIDVVEIHDYVFRKVPELTEGLQNPTFRKTNIENNFVVY